MKTTPDRIRQHLTSLKIRLAQANYIGKISPLLSKSHQPSGIRLVVVSCEGVEHDV